MIDKLKSKNRDERYSAINEIAGISQIDDTHIELLPVISNLLFDEFEDIRFTTAYGIVHFAEKGINISASEAQLAKALEDESLRVQKEADWALYCIAFEGYSIKNAVMVYEKEIAKKGNVRGNAAIALCLHYLNMGENDKAFDLIKMENGDMQFGAAWAHTDFTIRTGKKEFVKKVADIIRPALMDISMHNGVAGSLGWARHKGFDITPAVEGINELIKSTDNMMKEAKLSGIFMKMNKVKY